MRHIIHSEPYDMAVLIKDAALRNSEIEKHYLNQKGFKAISFSLDYGGKKKPTAMVVKDYLDTLLPVLEKCGVRDLLVCDTEYFKKLCKVQKADPHYGYVLPVAIPGYEHMNAVLCTNYQALLYNPNLQDKIDLALNTMEQHKAGSYEEIGLNIVKHEEYPDDYEKIQQWLNTLLLIPALSCDIEAFSLKHHSAGIGSIAFAWDTGGGIAFSVDYISTMPQEIKVWDKKDKKYKTRIAVGKQGFNKRIRSMLKDFFERYQGTLIWHNASYDISVLIYQLWMDSIIDQEGLLEGLEVMTRNFEDTKIITYLATNSCAGNKLGLKDQAHEFAGNYAEDDINDIRLIAKDQLLRYNLVDCLCTWYVMDKHYDTMILDEQYDLYIDLMKPHLIDIIQMQLTGMCLDMNQVHKAEQELQAIYDTHKNALMSHPIIKEFTHQLRLDKIEADNKKLKSKERTYEEVSDLTFNPNSGVQLQRLLYECIELPEIDYTKSGAPATGGKTLKKLSKITQNEDALFILNHLREYIGVNKVLTSFIPTFKEAPLAPDGMHYLFGSFILGGTVSGRLSSKNPNLQQIPSGSTYAKVIKKCFVAPPGWLFCGADFNALEDRINTLLTRDPNKEKVLIGSMAYDITVNGETHRLYEDQVLSFDGVEMTVKEFYEMQNR